MLNVDDRWPLAPLPRLRADTAERGTSRERHRWADVRGKYRVLQCPFNDVQGGLGPSVGGVLGRFWWPLGAEHHPFNDVYTKIYISCRRYLSIPQLGLTKYVDLLDKHL